MPRRRTYWLPGDEFTCHFDNEHTNVAIRVVAKFADEWCHLAVVDTRRTRYHGRFYLARLPHVDDGLFDSPTVEWRHADASGCELQTWHEGDCFLTSFADEPALVYMVDVVSAPAEGAVLTTHDVQVGGVYGTLDVGTLTVNRTARLGSHSMRLYRAYQARDCTTNTNMWVDVTPSDDARSPVVASIRCT